MYLQVIGILLTRGALNGLRLELKIMATLFGEMSFNVSGMVCLYCDLTTTTFNTIKLEEKFTWSLNGAGV
jgi:hypothetical protein